MPETNTQKIGRFPILKVLGRGSQGAVYLGKDPDLDRLVAIKLVAEIRQPGADTAAVSPQARNLARLRHPNIVALYEAGRLHNFTYLVFEYLEGTALRRELETRGSLPLPEAYSTMVQVTDAMAYAHAKGILHLDLNPNNIMRDGTGKPRIVDFDLSRTVGRPEKKADFIAGTVSYMAPEYFTTGDVDTRADVYALGQIFYELLTGRRAIPLTSNEVMVAQIRHCETDLGPLAAIDPGGHFAEVIRRATHKNVDERYANAREMHEALLAAWARTDVSTGQDRVALHGTVAYVLKRIERRGDFPAVSRTLAEVNQLTSPDSSSPVSRLTNVVLRDYALTNRLLKIANSSLHARASGRVKTVSDAISLLGLQQVRTTCNGLACFGHFAGRRQDHRLREESICAFVTGLIARHLAAQSRMPGVEEAFLAGMLYSLGRMLVLFYFADDSEEIGELVAGGADEEEAARTVLGITLAEIGWAVGRVWGLPQVALDCMDCRDAEQSPARDPKLRAIVRLARELVSVDVDRDTDHARLLAVAEALSPDRNPGFASLHALLAAALEKFRLFAPALEVDVTRSPSVQRIERWLAEFAPPAEAPAGSADALSA